jgi:hypothetical protein
VVKLGGVDASLTRHYACKTKTGLSYDKPKDHLYFAEGKYLEKRRIQHADGRNEGKVNAVGRSVWSDVRQADSSNLQIVSQY